MQLNKLAISLSIKSKQWLHVLKCYYRSSKTSIHGFHRLLIKYVISIDNVVYKCVYTYNVPYWSTTYTHNFPDKWVCHNGGKQTLMKVTNSGASLNLCKGVLDYSTAQFKLDIFFRRLLVASFVQ